MSTLTVKNKVTAGGSDTHWLLFFFFPFFSFLVAARSYRSGWAKNIVWAFIVFYGFTLAIGKEDLTEDRQGDIVRYVASMKALYGKQIDFNTAVDIFKDSGEADILQTIITILVSRFTDRQQVLTAVYGLIFGFFFSRNIWFIIDRCRGQLTNFAILFLGVLFLLNPFWNITGFRFNTAVHVFLMGVLPLLFDGKKRFLWISFLSILVHFTFFLPLSILGVYLLLGNRLNLYFGFFIISIFISNINVESFNNFIENNVPEAFVERSKSYRDEEKVEDFRQDEGGESDTKVWYAKYYIKFIYFALMAILIALFAFCRKHILKIKSLANAFSFTLLFFSVANIMNSLPSGGRFLMIAGLFASALLILYLQNQPPHRFLNNAILAMVPFLLLYIIVSLRISIYSFSLTTLVGNPLFIIFTDYNISINDLIK